MTTDRAMATAPSIDKPARPPRRHTAKAMTPLSAAAPLTPAALTAAFTQALPPQLPVPALSGNPLADAALKLMVWPLEQWWGLAHKGFEIARATHTAFHGLDRKIEAIVVDGQKSAATSFKHLAEQTQTSLTKTATAPLATLWAWPAATPARKEW